MRTVLIVVLSILGFFSLFIGGLIFLWFYQGGCCVRRIRKKISRKRVVEPILSQVGDRNPGASPQ